jgi:hypothetical protein
MIKLIIAFQLSIVRKKYLLCKSFRLGFGQNVCGICFIFDLACCAKRPKKTGVLGCIARRATPRSP